MQIKDYMIHPRYDNVTSDNDIAIILLDRVLNFTDILRPVCLPLPRLSYKHVNVFILLFSNQLMNI